MRPRTPTKSPFLQYSHTFSATPFHTEHDIKSVSYSPLTFLNGLGTAMVIYVSLLPFSDSCNSGSLTIRPTKTT